MAWDSGRPMPWRRVVTLFVVYALIANVALLLFARESYGLGTMAGMAVGFVIYLGVAWVLVKFGWNPPPLRPRQAAAEAAERRAATEVRRQGGSSSSAGGSSAAAGPRPKPAPTRRTNASNRRARH